MDSRRNRSITGKPHHLNRHALVRYLKLSVSLLLVSVLCTVFALWLHTFEVLSIDQKSLWIAVLIGIPQGTLALGQLLHSLFPQFFPKLKKGWLSFWSKFIVIWPIPSLTEAQIWGAPNEMTMKYFTERQHFLDDLHEKIYSWEENITGRQPLAITGMKGLGKSQEAYAYARWQCRSYHWVLWIDASSLGAFQLSCKHIIDEWGSQNTALATAGENRSLTEIEVVKKWLQIKQEPQHIGQRGLLILDGYSFRDNANQLSNSSSGDTVYQLVNDFIRLSKRSVVLITTDTGKEHIPKKYIDSIEIPNWTEDEGALFLLRRTKKNFGLQVSLEEAPSEERDLARKISGSLYHFPLALELAGAYIVGNNCSLKEYLGLYKKERERILQLRPNKITHPSQEAIATIWTVYIDQIKVENQAAGDLLQFCAYLASAPIPEEIITHAPDLSQALKAIVADSIEVFDAITILSRYSLMGRNPDTQTLILPGMVQTVIKDEVYRQAQQNGATHPGEKRRWIKRAILAVNEALQRMHIERSQDRQRFLLYLSHAQACADYIADNIKGHQVDVDIIASKEALELLATTGHYLQEHANYKEAEQFLIQAGELCQKMLNKGRLSKSSREVAGYYSYQADFYRIQGEYEKAGKLYLESHKIYEQLGDEPRTAGVLNSLGWLYDDWSEITDDKNTKKEYLTKSEEYYLQAWEKRRAVYRRFIDTPNDKQDKDLKQDQALNLLCGLMLTVSNLAWSYYKQSKQEKAQELLKENIKDIELILGASHHYITESHAGVTDWNIYEQIFKGILTVFQSSFGEDTDSHLYVAQCYMHLGVLYTLHKEYFAAQRYFSAASDVSEQYFGNDHNHPHLARWLNNLAVLYHRKGEPEKAEENLQKSLDIGRLTLGEQHPLVADINTNFAELYRSKKKTKEAADYEQQAEDIRKQAQRSQAEFPSNQPGKRGEGGNITTP